MLMACKKKTIQLMECLLDFALFNETDFHIISCSVSNNDTLHTEQFRVNDLIKFPVLLLNAVFFMYTVLTL